MSPIIVALDFPTAEQALNLATQLNPKVCRVKVGKELFTRAGPQVVTALQSQGFEVFLDLKYHDIPNTCAQAVLAAADLGVWMINVHASGGLKMMSSAKELLIKNSLTTKLIAVTVLTSMAEADLHALGVAGSLTDQVVRLARLTAQAGLDGVVCSAQEASLLHQELGTNFLKVTPGIRPASTQADDQQRIMTPNQALAAGSSHLVIGRPITQAVDPAAAVEAIIRLLPPQSA